MTESACNEQIVVGVENPRIQENIVPRKTIVYETLVDPTVLRVASEKLKTQLFSKFGLLKAKPEEIQFVSIDKYYEPYVVVSGRYVIDYYRRCEYMVRVDEGVLEVILFNNKLMPEHPPYSSAKDGIIRLQGEERLVDEAKASYIFDRYGRDASLERLPSAHPEKNPKKVIAEFSIEEVPQNADVDSVRSRLVKRPSDVKRIVTEIFEVGERVVIYTPQFRILYKNVRTGEEKAMEFDGVTSERVEQRESAISQSIRKIRSHLK